jgi:arylsulfatase A-like enzyme
LKARGFATGAVISSLPLKALVPGFDFAHERFSAAEASLRRYPIKLPEQTTRVAAQFFERHAAVPFFLWVHYFPPHGPYTPPQAFLSGDPQPPAERLAVSERNYEKGKIPAYQAQPGVFDAGEYRRRYAGHVRYVDAFVGRLLDQLRELRLYDDALVIVTSDHGESLGEHGWYFLHGNLVYQEQVLVPLIVKWPRQRAGGSLSSAPIELVDVAPTIAAALGIPGSFGDGRPLPGAGNAAARPRFVQSNDAELVAVLDGGAKLVVKRGPTSYTEVDYPALQFFRLDRDPGETRSVYEESPDIARRLESELRRRYPGSATPPKASAPENEEQLRALGYVN